VAVALFLLFWVGFALHRKATALFRAQSYIDGDNQTDMEKRYGWVVPFGQLAYLTAVFLLALYAGGALFTFLSGGLSIALIWSCAHNLRSIFYYRSFTVPGAARGNVWLSKSLLIRNRAHLYLEAALICFIAGIVLRELALLGGAFIMGAAGIGYLRRARQAESQL
jgi:hypothetical protein